MFLGIDLGTGSVKALLLSAEGEILNEHSEAYEVVSSYSGWAETETEAWWQATLKAVKRCCQGFEVSAIGLSGQMHGLVLCDVVGKPLRPAILWADMRSSSELQHYENLSLEQKQHLANPITAGMLGPSLLWLKDHESETYQQARWALLPKDWLRLKLTEQVYAEPSDASATLLYDLMNDCWFTEVMDALELRLELFAPLIGSGDIAGELSKDAAQAMGLKAGIPVAAGGADAACSAYGSNLTQAGQAQINLGTAMQIFAIRDQAVLGKNISTHLYRSVESNYYAMAAMQNAGIAFEWLRRILGLSWEEMYHEAFVQTQSSKGLIFLPYLTGERTPHLNPYAQACWQGMRLEHERCHLIRAAFEGVAFALKDGLMALEATGIQPDYLRLAGGGSIKPAWQELLADILAVPLSLVHQPSASALGAAKLAAKATATLIVESKESSQSMVFPKAEESYLETYELFKDTYRKLYLLTKT